MKPAGYKNTLKCENCNGEFTLRQHVEYEFTCPLCGTLTRPVYVFNPRGKLIDQKIEEIKYRKKQENREHFSKELESLKREITKENVAYHDNWRKLWEDHLIWTRMVIIGIFSTLKGTDDYLARLIQNYVDMENALKPYYLDDAKKMGALLEEHLLIGSQTFMQIKSGSIIKAQVEKWYSNAGDIANLMNNLNPNFWSLERAKSFWFLLIDATLEEAMANFKRNWKDDVMAFEKIQILGLKMADFFSDGISCQFPKKYLWADIDRKYVQPHL